MMRIKIKNKKKKNCIYNNFIIINDFLIGGKTN